MKMAFKKLTFNSIKTVVVTLLFINSYAVNQILSDQPRETIVEKIHDNLQEIGTKVKENSYPLSNYLIRKVSPHCDVIMCYDESVREYRLSKMCNDESAQGY